MSSKSRQIVKAKYSLRAPTVANCQAWLKHLQCVVGQERHTGAIAKLAEDAFESVAESQILEKPEPRRLEAKQI